MLRELKTRSNDGITVSLFWNSASKEDSAAAPLIVDVKSNGLPSFTILCDSLEDAREAYSHPYGCLNTVLKTGKVRGFRELQGV